MSEKWQQSEICIVINDKSQDSTAKHLSHDGLLHYKILSIIVLVKEFLKSVNIWGSYGQKFSVLFFETQCMHGKN